MAVQEPPLKELTMSLQRARPLATLSRLAVRCLSLANRHSDSGQRYPDCRERTAQARLNQERCPCRGDP